MKIKFATQTTAQTNSVTNCQAESFLHFYEDVLSQQRISEDKAGRTFIPSSFRQLERTAENVQCSSMAVFDIDQKPDDDIISLEEMEDVLMDLGYEHIIYTSFSNTAECPRFRIVIPFDRDVYPAEYPFIMSALVEDFDDYLDARFSKVIDRCWKNEVSRCYYTYTVHPDRINGAISFYNPGHTADALELKMRQSTYGQDFECTSAYKPRKPGSAVGALGRSYELNRLLGAMFRGSTEEQIVQRLLAHDQSTPGFGYFSDRQYSRHRPRPGESEAAAALRSAKAFVKSHINWLRRKTKSDFKIINKPGKNNGAVPQHDAVINIWRVEPQVRQGKKSTKLSCKVLSGEHAGSIFWHTLFHDGFSEAAQQVTQEMIQRLEIATKTKLPTPESLKSLAGKIPKGRIKLRPGSNEYPDQNEIGNIYIE